MKKILLSLALLLSAALAAAKSVPAPVVSLVPQPQSLSVDGGVLKMPKTLTLSVVGVSVVPAAQQVADYVALELGRHSALPVRQLRAGKSAFVTLRIDMESDNKEAYTLTIDKRGVVLSGASIRGLQKGSASLAQLLEANAATGALPCLTIEDAPRFPWRGMHMDVSRHFWTIEQVKQYLDWMAYYKFNKFHWHLTDDQGWRIEIKQYPELTRQGAWRKFNDQDRACIQAAKRDDNPDFLIPAERLRVEAGDTLYGGFYTQDQIREVVAYAAERGIDVLPEIDMPGHLTGAILGYPWITCFGKPSWGETFSAPLCPGKDSAMVFVQNIWKEVIDLFPYEYVHLGADEVEKHNWKKCPACQARMKAQGLKDEKELQAWFVKQMEGFFIQNGRKMIGWDEIVEGGGLTETGTIMWWRDWAPTALTEATARGNKAILTPDFLCYLDFVEMGIDLERVYRMEPRTYIPSWNLTDQQFESILGVQGNVWAEYIPSIRKLYYQVMPRMIALSEVAWSQPERKDWEGFKPRAALKIGELDRAGFNYRIPDFVGFRDLNVFVDTAVFAPTCNLPLPGITLRYTTDGSFPQPDSKAYTGPMTLTESVDFTLRGFRPDGTAGHIQKTSFRKESYAPGQAVAPDSTGLRLTRYQYRGRNCADIQTKGRLMERSVVSEVAIPKGARGWLGLIFEGYVEVPADGIYTFGLSSNDGSRMLVDDTLLVDNDGPHGDKEVISQRALGKGWHKVRIEFFDMNNGGSLGLRMAAPADADLKPLAGFKF